MYKHLIGTPVLVRANRAGVWMGTLAAAEGDVLRLTGARRLWSWTGALDASVLALRGPTGGRFGDPTDVILGPSAEVIEVHVASPAAVASVMGAPPWAR